MSIEIVLHSQEKLSIHFHIYTAVQPISKNETRKIEIWLLETNDKDIYTN